jgi:hypothetical protein
MRVCDTGVSPVLAARKIEWPLIVELFDFRNHKHGRDGHVTMEH